MKTLLLIFTCGCLLISSVSFGQNIGEVLSKNQPKLSDPSVHTQIPLEFINGKLYLNAFVNGKPFRFALDTGSPSMLHQTVATELGLAALGKNTGIDASGNKVTTELAVVDSLMLGDAEFNRVPVFVFSPAKDSIIDCFIADGVIGSEILPLALWQINLPERMLTITTDKQKLSYLKGAKMAMLKSYGYPFAPVIPHKINHSLNDNALLDTGADAVFALNQLAYEELQKKRKVAKSAATGYGTMGESAGGRGEPKTNYLVNLKRLKIGTLELSNMYTWTRPIAPSLIGLGLFAQNVVTLDYPNQQVHFSPVDTSTSSGKETLGFKFGINKDSVTIAWIKTPSIAQQKGLQVGQKVLSINGYSVADGLEDNLCQFASQLHQFEGQNNGKLSVTSEGQSAPTEISF